MIRLGYMSGVKNDMFVIKNDMLVVKMTCFSIKEVFKKKVSYQNLDKAVSVMGCIFATYASSKNNKIISLPLSKKYHKIKVNFAWTLQFFLEEKIARVLKTKIYFLKFICLKT